MIVNDQLARSLTTGDVGRVDTAVLAAGSTALSVRSRGRRSDGA
jgi:hypothetical protein